MTHSNKLGRQGEELALSYLLGQGYSLIQKDYHIRGGQIDLIVQREGVLVFVEVKTRTTPLFGTETDTLSSHQLKTLRHTAFDFLYNRLPHLGYKITDFKILQFDLITLDFSRYMQDGKLSVKHYHAIIE